MRDSEVVAAILARDPVPGAAHAEFIDSVVSAYALWTRHRRAAEFTYLWALSASLQATEKFWTEWSAKCRPAG